MVKQYGWTINNVKKHQDFSNKYCPHRTLDNGWKRFLTMIEVELSNLNKPANTVKYRVVTGSFSSLDNANARVKELKAKGFDSFILAE